MQFTKLTSTLTLLASLSGAAFAQIQTTASFDNHFDDASASTNIVACSNLTPQHPTLGSFPTFPNIGGSFAITGFGSAECGSCWRITDTSTGVGITVTAIDVAGEGFNLSEEALNTLTNGLAVQIGRANVTAVQVAASNCGL